MNNTTNFQLRILQLLFLFYCCPVGYWFLVTVPIDLIMNNRITEFTGLALFIFPFLVVFSIFLVKISFFSIKFEKIVFSLMILMALAFFSMSFFYSSSIDVLLLSYILILITSSVITPYLFAKIFNIITIDTKIQTLLFMFLIWFGGGVFYITIFLFFNPTLTFMISGFSVLVGLFIHYFYVLKPKKYTQIQLLPFNYSSIANGNVLGIFVVLTLFWSVAIVILKEFRISMSIFQFNLQFKRFEILWLFLTINVIIGLFFFFLNKRLNLRLLYYIDYLLISFSVVIALFWKSIIPVSFIFVSSFGITTFALSMPDLMDVNKGVIGPSFMSFFQILLLIFPFAHISIYLMDTALTDIFASYLLIIVIIAMALISGIRFLPVPVNKEYLIISHKDGIPLYSAGIASSDEKIISGLLTGILAILSTGSSDAIKTIDHGDKKIMISISNRIFGVVVCDRYSKTVGYKLQEIVDLFEVGFDKLLDLNSFNVQLFKKLPPLLVKKIDIFLS